jgi:tRNA(Ile)-lysidine synthase
MLAHGDAVVLAVSGGADSMALLHGVAALAPDLALSIHVAHFNHRLRPEAGADAAFVAAACRGFGFPFHTDQGDPGALAARDGLSPEDAARRLRYAFLLRVAETAGAAALATGHTLDDQAETVLLRLLRGSGLAGLAAIPPVRRERALRIVRPLIDTTHEEAVAYLQGAGAHWREDATNRDLHIMRNRVRRVLLPTLEGYNPGVRRTLARTAALLRDDAAAIEALAAAQIADAISGESGIVSVSRQRFAALLPAVQRRVVREAVRRAAGNSRGLQFVHIAGARELILHGAAGSWVPLPGGLRATSVADGAEIGPAPPDEDGAPAPAYRLAVPGRILALEFGLQVVAEEVESGERPKPETQQGTREEIVVDRDKVRGGLVLRGPRPGDRFAPEGMGGRTKMVSDFLRDEKIPRHRRSRVPVLTTADGAILWIVGRRAGEGLRPAGSGDRAIRIVAHRLRAGHDVL